MSTWRRCGAVVAACSTLLVSGCWLQPGFDGGSTRRNPWEHQLTAGNVDGLAQAWSMTVPSRNPSVTPPLVFHTMRGPAAVHVPRRSSARTVSMVSASAGDLSGR
jgi:hypothetical protein